MSVAISHSYVELGLISSNIVSWKRLHFNTFGIAGPSSYNHVDLSMTKPPWTTCNIVLILEPQAFTPWCAFLFLSVGTDFGKNVLSKIAFDLGQIFFTIHNYVAQNLSLNKVLSKFLNKINCIQNNLFENIWLRVSRNCLDSNIQRW